LIVQKNKAHKLPPAFARFAKFAKAVFGVPKTEVEAEDAKWRSERAERRGARKKSGAA
jgi:hypothetical protein